MEAQLKAPLCPSVGFSSGFRIALNFDFAIKILILVLMIPVIFTRLYFPFQPKAGFIPKGVWNLIGDPTFAKKGELPQESYISRIRVCHFCHHFQHCSHPYIFLWNTTFRHVETFFVQGRNLVPNRSAIGW